MPMTRESSGWETDDGQEASDEGETKIDEVVGKLIERRKSYIFSFQLGVLILY